MKSTSSHLWIDSRFQEELNHFQIFIFNCNDQTRSAEWIVTINVKDVLLFAQSCYYFLHCIDVTTLSVEKKKLTKS